MKKEQKGGLPEIYFKAMWLLTVVLYILIPTESGILSAVYYGIHFFTIGVFFLILFFQFRQSQLDQFNTKRVLALFIMACILMFSILCTAKTITFETHIMGILGFLEMLLAVYIMDYVPYKKSLFQFVCKTNVVIAVVFIILSVSPYAYSHKLEESLSLGYSNPNATAIYLLLNMSILLLYAATIKGQLKKLFMYGLCAYLMYLLYATDSRTCFLAGLVVAVYTVLAPKWKIPMWVVPLFQLFSLAFLYFYSTLYKKGLFLDLEIMGKPFYSGREDYFIAMLERLKGYWLVGDVGLNPFNNMHNGALTLLSSCGVLGFLVHFWYVNRTIRFYYQGEVEHRQTVALMIIAAAFIHASAEAALLVGGANYTIIMASLYWMLKKSEDDSERNRVAQIE